MNMKILMRNLPHQLWWAHNHWRNSSLLLPSVRQIQQNHSFVTHPVWALLKRAETLTWMYFHFLINSLVQTSITDIFKRINYKVQMIGLDQWHIFSCLQQVQHNWKIYFNFSKCKYKILQILLYEYSLVFILVTNCSPLCIGGGGDYLFSLLQNVNKHNELHGLKFSKIKNRGKTIYPTSENQLVRIRYTA